MISIRSRLVSGAAIVAGLALAVGTANLAGASSPNRATNATPTVARSGPTGGPVPKGFVPYSATWVSASDGWVLGTAPCTHKPCGSVVRTTNGGRTWRGIPAPEASVTAATSQPAGALSIIRFANRSDGWAAGRGLWATHNGGASWHKLSVGTKATTVISLETGGGYVYALAEDCSPNASPNCPHYTRVYAARIGSDSWHAVTGKISLRRSGSQLVVRGSSWYLATETSILRGHAFSQPVALPSPCPSDEGGRATALLAVADAAHLDALCAGDGGAGSATIQLYGTTDGAHHWRKAGGAHRMFPDYLTGIADNTRGVLMVSTASGSSFLFRTTDDGRVFHDTGVRVPTGGFPWTDLGFTTTSQAQAVLPGHGFYLSRNAGRSWGRVTF